MSLHLAFLVGLICSGVAASQGTLPSSSRDLDGVWVRANVGGGGWFERCAIGPGGTLIACSDLSGAYVSHDKGASWDCIGPGAGLTETHVSCAAFDPGDDRLAFLGTEAGIFRSDDGARSFERVLAGGYVESIAVAPTSSASVYAAWHPDYNTAGGQVYRSTDGGFNWTLASINLPPNVRLVRVLVSNADANLVFIQSGDSRFASSPADLFRSQDGGVTWTSIAAPFSGRLVDCALDPFDPHTLWASVDDSDPNAAGHLYQSTDDGSQWTHVDQRGGSLWLPRQAPGTIRMIEARYQFPFDSREGIWESTQSGQPGTWTKLSSVVGWERGWTTALTAFNATSLHGALAAHPSDPNELIWVTTQFVYGTQDGGNSVQALYTQEAETSGSGRWQSTGVDNVVVLDLDVNQADPNQILAGFFDLGLWRSLDGGETWAPVNDPVYSGAWEGAGGNAWFVQSDPAQTGLIWAAQGDDPYQPQTLLRSIDVGTTWTAIGNGLPARPLLGLALDTNSPTGNRTLFITADGDVWRSTDHGTSFTRVLQEGGLRFCAVDRFNSNIVYAGGEDGLWRSLAGGAVGTWSDVSHPDMRGSFSGEPATGWEGVFAIETDPHITGRLWVAAHGPGKGLYVSSDSGTTWQKLLSDDYLRCVAVDPNDASRVLVGSSSAFDSGGFDTACAGVQRSLDGGQTFQPFNPGLSWPFAGQLVFDSSDPSRILLASPGPGIHILKAAPLCPRAR